MLVLGLTGSVGMGKSTVAGMFADEGAATFNADDTVHALYRGAAAPLVESEFPGTVVDGVVDRARLGQKVLGDKGALARLERIVHPLVRKAEEDFRVRAAGEGRRIVLLDIPLLFEKGSETRMDAVIVVSAPAEIQRERVLARPGMTEERFDSILASQMPDAEKRLRAHFVIDTGGSLERTRGEVRDILRALAATASAR